ncbi:unnamed protein product [Sphenostylis stenocarpa]|uniref:Uncharacterized protein n=1 Tax=Sphenostylis stenocarpa TaxID=92480 RepID=A0AA86VW53_9FABA|nr:unnamed protein product [Sphenostylis stenocarpa]
MQNVEMTEFSQSGQISKDLSLTSPTSQSKNNESAAMRKRKWGKMKMEKEKEKEWKIKKVLTKSDVGRLSRLLFRADMVETLMLPVQGAHAQIEANSGTGTPVSVWDVDTMSMHKLILKRWPSFNNFVLNGGWSRDFVRRRKLNHGDEIGLLWDSYTHCFHFSLLKPIH